MRDHYIVRQPQPPFGGTFGLFQPGQFFPPGQGPGSFLRVRGRVLPPGQGRSPPAGTWLSSRAGTRNRTAPGRPPAFVPSRPGTADDRGICSGSRLDKTVRVQICYIWLDNGQQFWAWLIFVGGTLLRAGDGSGSDGSTLASI